MSSNRITDLDTLEGWLWENRHGKEIVTTNGCFDLLHVGHARYLREARDLGGLLIVGVNPDDSVVRLKGPSRPLVTLSERMEMLASLRWVDWVLPFPDGEDTPVSMIDRLRPEIHVKGGSFDGDRINLDRKAVESYGGKLAILSKVSERSTTNLISKIRRLDHACYNEADSE